MVRAVFPTPLSPTTIKKEYLFSNLNERGREDKNLANLNKRGGGGDKILSNLNEGGWITTVQSWTNKDV